MKNRLKGTKTEQNLLNALKGESEARNKYTYFASAAKKEGYNQIANIFEETANNEKEHAKLWFKLLYGIYSTKENLKTAIEGEGYEARIMYPQFAKEAREEGFDEIAFKFEQISEVEAFHELRYKKLLQNIETNTIFRSNSEKNWHCLNCGYIHKSKSAPEECPACNHPKSYFEIKPENY